MKFKSPVYSEASGSIAGITYSHNRGGLYTRARAVPVNPNTPQQQLVRSLMAQLTNLWVSTLTAPQRAGWDAYAENVPITNPLGAAINVGGVGMYVRSNVPRLQSSLPRVDTAPTVMDLGPYTQPDFTGMVASTALQTVTIPFDVLDDWVGEDDSAMLTFVGRPQNPSINYFKGPYRAATAILGDATTPPTSPASVTTPFPFVTGQRLFVRVNVSRADGRLGTESRGFILTVA